MGNYLSVSRAKESFLDRLKKEREGNTIGSKLLALSMNENVEIQEEKITPKFKLPTIQKEVSSEESSEESEEEEIVPVRPQKFIATKPAEPKKLDQATIDDMKRQKSLQKLKEMNKEKRDAIKNALSSIDSVPRNNKIVFEEPESIAKSSKPKANLFDEDEDMEEETPESFKLKKQFEGVKGEKLFELQTRFQGDKRFQIDEKFAEVADDIIDSRKKYTREELKERKKFRKEMQDWDQNELKEERDNQLSILESITGQSTGVTDKFSKPAQKGMLRFDPTKKSHQKYLDVVKGDEDVDDDDSNESGKNNQQSEIVGEDRFYEVSDNLTKALQTKSESKPFSIFGMLGIERKSDDENIDEPREEVEIKLPPKINAFHLAKFKYESSDTDEEVEAAKMAKKKKVKPQKVTKFGKYSKNGVFHYNFFFRDDDPRLKEGLKFLIKHENETPEALQEKRQKLKAIVKNSIRKAKKDQNAKQGYSKKRKVNKT